MRHNIVGSTKLIRFDSQVYRSYCTADEANRSVWQYLGAVSDSSVRPFNNIVRNCVYKRLLKFKMSV